jgi:hypothetical protein
MESCSASKPAPGSTPRSRCSSRSSAARAPRSGESSPTRTRPHFRTSSVTSHSSRSRKASEMFGGGVGIVMETVGTTYWVFDTRGPCHGSVDIPERHRPPHPAHRGIDARRQAARGPTARGRPRCRAPPQPAHTRVAHQTIRTTSAGTCAASGRSMRVCLHFSDDFELPGHIRSGMLAVWPIDINCVATST